MKYLTEKMLSSRHACARQARLFNKFLDGRARVGITARNIKLALDAGLDVGWAIGLGLVGIENQDAILETGDARLAFRLALKMPGADIERCLSVIEAAKDAEKAYWFAWHIPGADIERCLAVIEAAVGAEWAYAFALDVPGADIERCLAVIEAAGEAEWAYWFARNVPGTDVSRCLAVAEKSGNARWAGRLVLLVKNRHDCS